MAIEDRVQVFPDHLLVTSTGVLEGQPGIPARVSHLLDLVRANARDTALIDERGLRFGGDPNDMFVPVYESAKIVIDDGSAKGVERIALIAPAGPRAQVQFVEDAFRNRGMDLRYFYDEPSARNWLADHGSGQSV